MKILYGTGNAAKLSVMKRRLERLNGYKGLNIEIIGLNDMDAGTKVPQVAEDGATPLENACKKAEAYYQAFQMPVFSCDSGLYFENVPDNEQPGVHVRNINGVCLTDEEMLAHYAGLAGKYGNLTAYYKNAICFVYDESHKFGAMEQSMESQKFIITSKPHSAPLKRGFPIDSLSIDIKTGRYFYDLPEKELDELAVEDGFLQFFECVLREILENGPFDTLIL